MKKRAAIYLRVSKEGQATENQVLAVKRLVRTRGFAVVETYEEHVSVAKARPEFDRMMGDAHRGMFNVLVLWAIERNFSHECRCDPVIENRLSRAITTDLSP